LLLSAPNRSRRITTSRNIRLLEKLPKTGTWRLDHRSIFYLFRLFRPLAYEIREDHDGFLLSFGLPARCEVPPWKGDP
jgi:hypothetical protein